MDNLNLYRVTLKGMNACFGSVTHYGKPYVVAHNLDEAYNKVKEYLDKRDLGFSRERELVSIELLAGTGDYPVGGYQLFL